MKQNLRSLCVSLIAAFALAGTVVAQDYFANFPIKADPKIVGKRVSSRLLETKHQLYGDRGIHYAEVCTLVWSAPLCRDDERPGFD